MGFADTLLVIGFGTIFILLFFYVIFFIQRVYYHWKAEKFLKAERRLEGEG